MKREKPMIRVPSDAEHGPNPYDSKTPIKETQPRWLWDWTWWVAVIGIGITLVAVRYFTHTL